MACTGYEIKFNGGLTAPNIWLEKSSADQKGINTYIDVNQKDYIGKTCLHIGTGNSSIAINHHKLFKHIDGLAIEPGEVSLANNLMIPNYTCYLINKYKLKELSVLGEYDVIIDNNIKTYMCCDDHYDDYFNWILRSVASRNGEIITHTAGYYHLDNNEIDSIASRVQYRSYQKADQSVVLIKPI
jgi:hypothetical protein